MKRIGTRKGRKASARRRRAARERNSVSKHEWGRFKPRNWKKKKRKARLAAKVTSRRNRRHGGKR